jgi:hypothetical protein
MNLIIKGALLPYLYYPASGVDWYGGREARASRADLQGWLVFTGLNAALFVAAMLLAGNELASTGALVALALLVAVSFIPKWAARDAVLVEFEAPLLSLIGAALAFYAGLFLVEFVAFRALG